VSEGCVRAEVLAGAIALGEATEMQRDAYRRHLACCPACCERLGGERQIERAARTVAEASDDERWEPSISFSQMRERRRRRLRARIAASVVAIAATAAIALRALSTPHDAPVMHVARMASPVVHHVQKPPARLRHIVVVHNVVTLSAPAPAEPPARPKIVAARRDPVPVKAPQRVAQIRVPARASTPPSNVPIWRRNEPLPLGTPAPIVGHAEAIAVAPIYVIREVMPVGGENAIEPQPPMIAYAERAQGTTAFDVSVNERGVPTKCTITKSSGYLSLDGAVCRAAMKARYFPKTINGRAVTSVYRDAFTFRESDTEPEFP
jgi:TonB family protein